MESRLVRPPVLPRSLDPESPHFAAAKESLTDAIMNLRDMNRGGRYQSGATITFDDNLAWFPTPGIQDKQERRGVLLACLTDGINLESFSLDQLPMFQEFQELVINNLDHPYQRDHMVAVPNPKYNGVHVGYELGKKELALRFNTF